MEIEKKKEMATEQRNRGAKKSKKEKQEIERTKGKQNGIERETR